jgi:hypothetical protein
MSSSSGAPSSTEKVLARIRAALALGLMDAENFTNLMNSNSGDVEELRRVALSLAKAIDLVEERAKSLDPHDPTLIVPREIVSALAAQASTGEAIIAEWLDGRKSAAMDAINVGVAQASAIAKMSSKLKELLSDAPA